MASRKPLPIASDWRDRAKCAQPEYRDLMWFPQDWYGRQISRDWMKKERNRAIKVCFTCPVIAECHAFAVKHQVTDGIWAGKHYVWDRGRFQ